MVLLDHPVPVFLVFLFKDPPLVRRKLPFQVPLDVCRQVLTSLEPALNGSRPLLGPIDCSLPSLVFLIPLSPLRVVLVEMFAGIIWTVDLRWRRLDL